MLCTCRMLERPTSSPMKRGARIDASARWKLLKREVLLLLRRRIMSRPRTMISYYVAHLFSFAHEQRLCPFPKCLAHFCQGFFCSNFNPFTCFGWLIQEAAIVVLNNVKDLHRYAAFVWLSWRFQVLRSMHFDETTISDVSDMGADLITSPKRAIPRPPSVACCWLKWTMMGRMHSGDHDHFRRVRRYYFAALFFCNCVSAVILSRGLLQQQVISRQHYAFVCWFDVWFCTVSVKGNSVLWEHSNRHGTESDNKRKTSLTLELIRSCSLFSRISRMKIHHFVHKFTIEQIWRLCHYIIPVKKAGMCKCMMHMTVYFSQRALLASSEFKVPS